MDLFVIIGRDGPDAKTLRPQLRPRHLDHVRAYDGEGRIRLAGPLTDGAGSLIVLAADSEQDARAFAEADPYATGGVFDSVEIHPFKQVFPE